MSAPVALRFEGVWKRYDREQSRRATLKQAFLSPLGRFKREWFWALSEIDLSLHEGETIGLVGANGAGKSTLLRLAAGLGKPTVGKVRTHRKTEAILTLGDTFDPSLTGRENALSASSTTSSPSPSSRTSSGSRSAPTARACSCASPSRWPSASSRRSS
jgi:lipopolysaccharide transport system ATP-binding protein